MTKLFHNRIYLPIPSKSKYPLFFIVTVVFLIYLLALIKKMNKTINKLIKIKHTFPHIIKYFQQLDTTSSKCYTVLNTCLIQKIEPLENEDNYTLFGTKHSLKIWHIEIISIIIACCSFSKFSLTYRPIKIMILNLTRSYSSLRLLVT